MAMNDSRYEETKRLESLDRQMLDALKEAQRAGLDVALIGRYLNAAVAPLPPPEPMLEKADEARRKRIERAESAARKRHAEILAKAHSHDLGGPTETAVKLRAFAELIEAAESAMATPTPLEAIRAAQKAPDVTETWALRGAVLAQYFRVATGAPKWRTARRLLHAMAAMRDAGPVPTADALEKSAARCGFSPLLLHRLWSAAVKPRE